jgi:hypothetical protein
MERTKIVITLIVASVLVAAFAGIAFAQFAGAQTAGNFASQTPQGTTGNVYAPYPQQGYYAYGQQYASPYGFRMGMCGRFW